MKLLKVRMGNLTDLGWQFPELRLKNTNLFVGESASGKSTLLNMIFDIGVKVVQDAGTPSGYFKFNFEQDAAQYEWEINIRPEDDGKVDIFFEQLTMHVGDADTTVLIDRKDTHIVVNGNAVPKMSKESTCIYLFREDAAIKPVHEAFKQIMRRDFAGDALTQASQLQSVSKKLLNSIEKDKSRFSILRVELSVNTRLYLLKQHLKESYTQILDAYRNIFPFVEAFEFKDMSESAEVLGLSGRIPYLHIKDRNSPTIFPMSSLSSGMKKVLLMLTDIVMLPAGSVYLIDEYENSLGVNAISFLPLIIAEHGEGKQFIITSHHPYLINALPVENWIVFHRRGQTVSVKHGDELRESYGKSKQQAFIKLLNDPFFTEGA